MSGPKIQIDRLTAAVTLTVVVVVFSQFFAFESNAYFMQDVADVEQHDDQSNDDNEVYISQPSSSLPSPSHVVVNQAMVFLFEILFERKESEKGYFEILATPNFLFKRFFDGVISPNAP